MRLETNVGEAPHGLEHQERNTCHPSRYGWPTFDSVTPFDFAPGLARYSGAAQLPLSTVHKDTPNVQLMSPSAGVALLRDKAIAIAVIHGPSKGLTRRFNQRRISIGRGGGATDLAIEDQGISDLHCAVDVTPEAVRLYDLGSASGTYVNEEQIQSVEIQHLSEFRIGSSRLLVLILPKQEQEMDAE